MHQLQAGDSVRYIGSAERLKNLKGLRGTVVTVLPKTDAWLRVEVRFETYATNIIVLAESLKKDET